MAESSVSLDASNTISVEKLMPIRVIVQIAYSQLQSVSSVVSI